MHRGFRSLALVCATALVAGVPLSACSFANSSKSSSRSSSSPSDWASASSRSSSGGSTPDRKKVYEEDVAETTAAFVRGGGDIGSYRSVLSQLAARNGIDHWEKDPTTLKAIGVGIARATDDPGERSAAIARIAGDDATRKQLIEEGIGSSF